jgi:hypothetical protein
MGVEMTIGPVQLLVLGFDDPRFAGGFQAELDRLRDSDLVRLIDGVAVRKDTDGTVTVMDAGDVDEQLSGFGAVVGALVGLGSDFSEGAPELYAEALPDLFDGDRMDGASVPIGDWDVLAEIPEGTAAALLLVEHRWAIPLRDALSRAGGSRLASEFVSPLDLVAFGMVSPGEARRLMADESDVL